MMEVMFQGEPVNREAIADLEQKLQCSLPEDYVGFLLQYNGGRPVPDDFPISSDSGSSVGTLLHVTDGATREKRATDLWVWNDRKRRQGELPPDVIMIGYDMGGSPLCLGVTGERRGEVFFLDSERLEGEPLEKYFWKIADTFSEFLGSLGTSP